MKPQHWGALALPAFAKRPTGLQWLRLMRPGDALVLATLIVLVLQMSARFIGTGPVDRALIRREGDLVAEVMLAVSKRIDVQGPLGTTVIEIEPGRARIASDPGLKQLCVQQGWLEHANATALCLPNRVSLQVVSSRNRHDSIGY